MSRRSRLRSISPGDPRALEKVIEAIEVGAGARGRRRDRYVTLGEVEELVQGGGSSSLGSSGSTGSAGVPDKPSGVTLTVLQEGIAVSWNKPLYSGHGKTEVWRSATGLIGDASLIGVSAGTVFTDYDAGNSQSWSYFLRHLYDVSLGAGSGPFSSAATEISSDPLYVGGVISNAYLDVSEVVAGTIADTTAIQHVFQLSDSNSPRVLIRMQGAFSSSEVYTTALQPEDGNTVSVEVLRNGSSIGNFTATKMQTNITDANGQKVYVNYLQVEFADSPPAGSITYQLQATRTFPSNTTPFKVAYSLLAMRS